MSTRPDRVLLAGLVALVCSTGCGSNGATTAPTTTRQLTRLTVEEQHTLVRALCDSDRSIRAGDAVLGRAIYFEHAHESLHTLIEDVTRADEPAGARLEGAHNQIETAFAYLKQKPEISAELDLFRTALEAGSKVVGVDTTCR